MDKSLHSQIYGGVNRSPYTSRTRQSSASSIVSGRKSLHSGVGGFKKSSVSGRFSVSGRSHQSQAIVARSEYNIVESYGAPLPVLVNEALTFSERSAAVSINCSNNGWAWAVTGRRLLIWQYKDTRPGSPRSADLVRTPQRRTTTGTCRELTLPHCDIGHKATLITVFMSEGQQQMASCLAVSPTGDVRYWPSIAHDGSSHDVTGILDGQEFDYLFGISPLGYVLVTTTCSLVVLQLQTVNGRPSIQHKMVKPPTGFFGGISKKFASIIIGMNSGSDKENKFVKIDGFRVSNSDWLVTILADRWIQRWLFSSNGSEQFLFEDHEFIRKIRDEFQQKFWNTKDHSEIDLTVLDMTVTEKTTFVLCGAVNNAHTPQMHYAIVQLQQEVDAFKIVAFLPLKLTQFYSAGTQSECLQLRFVMNRGIAYLYGEKTIHPVNLSNPQASDLEAEKIEFQAQDDKIMSAAVHGQIPLFFTRSHGLVCVSPSDFDASDFVTSSYSPDVFTPPFSDSTNLTMSVMSPNVTAGNLSMYELDPDEIYNDKESVVSRLKAAFIYHLKRNSNMCSAILQEILPAGETVDTVDSVLDKTVVTIAEDLAEDIPAADPRWEQYESGQRYSLGSSSSLQITTQLREKNLALGHFVEFLHSVELWDRLNAVSTRGVVKSTCQALSDINEKIVAAIALKNTQSSQSKLVDEAMQNVLSEWNETPSGNLIPQDLFYVKLTRFQDFVRVLTELVSEKIRTQHSTTVVCSLLSDMNAVLLSVLNEVISFRETNKELYALPVDKKDSFEYLPWTAMSGRSGLRDTLLHAIDITLKLGARSTGEPEVKQRLYQQMVDLVDFVLDGRKRYLDSVKDNEKYGVLLQQFESQRRDLIFPLVEDEQYELAAKLAEKYLDFQALVVICDRTGNLERLDKYIEKYKEHDFSQFAINWHLRQNRQGDLFERFRSYKPALLQFLGDHPSLAWVQLTLNGDFNRAAKILYELAQDETESVARKKSMLSLAKLASIAADSYLSVEVVEINKELLLIDYQEQLTDNLLLAFGYDVENPKVLRAEEIINLLISEENDTATEFEFRKALELLNFVDDPFDVRHKIWCAAILRDTWTGYDMNAPLDRLQEMLFFKLIEVCYLMDGDLEEFLPPMEDFLLSSDLGDLQHDKSFQYLLKLGYEHISDSYHKKEYVEQ